MVWVILMMGLLPGYALGANLVIPTTPPQVEIRDVKYHQVSYGFQEEEPGRYQLQVNVRYRKWTSRIERVKHFTFRLQSGTIVQRDDRTLSLRLDDREIVVGNHRWWYSPYWQTANGARITCDRDRRIRQVVLGNCRLIVSSFEQRTTEIKIAGPGNPLKKRKPYDRVRRLSENWRRAVRPIFFRDIMGEALALTCLTANAVSTLVLTK